ncbi:MAG: hypothetical protein ACI8RD_000828, partial [Bacillariaceae sp.]|jgi:hypothetical protein
VYATATLTICIVTTVFCGGFTEKMLVIFEMREVRTPQLTHGTDHEDDNLNLNSVTFKPPIPRPQETHLLKQRRRITEGIKGVWYRFDDQFLKPYFGGEHTMTRDREILERQCSNDHDDSSNINNINREEMIWSSSSTGEYEMGKVSMNGLENTTKGKQTLDRNDSIGEEMISLTSRQEE